ncbi:RNA polymerase sigma-70 factor, ECF subfamily [Blastococcus fimeti]|nr:RNA polymerase sigma-70 factor, ECF subfamily [Blastococcus fimeti]
MTPEESFAEFYSAHKDRCLRALVAAGTDRAAAEEAVAEAFARAWASWPKVSRHPAPSAWVVRTALNHHVSRWRRTRREVALSADVAASTAGRAADPPERDDLLRAVAALPERQRQVVALRVFLDLDTRQTAEALDLAPGTVTAHLHRALTTLRATTAPDLEVCS